MAYWQISLTKFQNSLFCSKHPAIPKKPVSREFHIRREIREMCSLNDSLFSISGNVVFTDIRQARDLAQRLNSRGPALHPEQMVSAGQLNAMGLIDEILHYIVALYREQFRNDVFDTALQRLDRNLGEINTAGMLNTACM